MSRRDNQDTVTKLQGNMYAGCIFLLFFGLFLSILVAVMISYM